ARVLDAPAPAEIRARHHLALRLGDEVVARVGLARARPVGLAGRRRGTLGGALLTEADDVAPIAARADFVARALGARVQRGVARSAVVERELRRFGAARRDQTRQKDPAQTHELIVAARRLESPTPPGRTMHRIDDADRAQ